MINDRIDAGFYDANLARSYCSKAFLNHDLFTSMLHSFNWSAVFGFLNDFPRYQRFPCCRPTMKDKLAQSLSDCKSRHCHGNFLGVLETSFSILRSALGVHCFDGQTWECFKCSKLYTIFSLMAAIK
ncbi:hypothetical protein ATANTOWER_028201 [Ataeniobius toweri]|uniref:Uncharacterized protein n=1 Tax=Ataeniobius toweri TaxID=208326 RepID=A0ABU7ALF8_9TELE|nr:hypothetical protein [Ataeniobius toweri]